MGCCQSDLDDNKRHPLLRTPQQDSSSSPVKKSVDSTTSTKGISIHVISHLEVELKNLILLFLKISFDSFLILSSI